MTIASLQPPHRLVQLYRDRLSGKLNIGETEGQQVYGQIGPDGVPLPPPQALAEGYILLAVRKDRGGSLVNTTGDLSPLKVTRMGELWVAGASVTVWSSNGTGITASGLTTVVPAPQPGIFLRVHALQASSASSSAVGVSWLFKGGVKSWWAYLSANTSMQRIFAPNTWDLPDATALQLNCDITPLGSGVQWTVEGELLSSTGS